MKDKITSKYIRPFYIAVLACACLTLSVSGAKAQGISLGGSVGYLGATTDGVSDGSEWSGHLGTKFDAGPIEIQPEFMASFIHLGNNDGSRWQAGARLWIGEFLQPGGFAHIGYGKLGGDSGLTYDVGALLDIDLIIVQAGLHLAYGGISLDRTVNWINFGAHAQLNF